MTEQSRALSAETVKSVLDEVSDAKARGWSQDDLRRWFGSQNVSIEAYKAALAGQDVSQSVAAVMAQVSITGLPSKSLAPNPADIKRHIEWLIEPALGDYDDALFEIAWQGDNGWKGKLFELTEVDEAVSFAADRNAEERNIYIGAAMRLPDTKRNARCSAADFYVGTAVPIDIDENYEDTRAKLAGACDDGLTVVTGTIPTWRSQHWTRLLEPCDDEMEYGHAFASLVMHTGADMKVKDPARIMRLGGTVSYPDSKKTAKGYVPQLTKVIVRADAARSSIDKLKALSPSLQAVGSFESRPSGGGSEIERHWTGRVENGRESYFRNELLINLRHFHEEHNADPTERHLFDITYADFSNPAKVNNEDQRWTCPAGQEQLMHRVQNTMRRLRSGRLARLGLYSRATGEGKEQAQEVAANRLAALPKPFVEAVEGQEVTVSTTEPQTDMRGSSIFDPWHQFVVPTFPMDTLAPHLRRYVDYLSTSTGGDPAACAMAALAACSGALDQEFSLKMKRSGEWHAKPRLWVLLIGSPSSKKSPIVSSCIKPIRSWEAVGVQRYQKEYARWKEDKDSGVKGEAEPKRPTRYLLNSVTSEKLGEILSRQDRGIMVEQDEVSGWIGSMEKYGGKGGSADRAFWLTAFNGGPVTIDRLGRGETFVNNLAVAFVGGVQPDRLMELGNLASDGLLQRFLPVMMQRAVYSSEVESDQPRKDYETTIHELIKAKPSGLIMDAGALKVVEEFQRFLFDLENMDGLGKNFCSFVGKLSGLHGSLSLVLHMIEDPENAAIEPVSEKTVRDAERIITEFCIPHALEFYRGAGDGADWDYLRKLASYVLTSEKDRFTVSDFTSGVHSLRGMSVWDVTQKISPLVAGGWLIEDEASKTVRSWSVVAGLREALAERRKEEAERKEEVVSKMNSLKRGRGRK